MRLVAATLFLAATAACGHAQQQRQETPAYGLGAPWPEASIDTAQSTIRNEITVYFVPELDEERAGFVVDSLAQELNAAVRRTRATTYTSYTFRWPPELPIDRNAVIHALEARPEVERVRPGILVSVGGDSSRN